MSLLHLATEDDLARLTPMVAAAVTQSGKAPPDEDAMVAALAPLLAGSPHGAVWLIGPRKAPVGFVAVSFGWSLAAGGLEARIDTIFIRPAVRNRGMGSEALASLAKALTGSGVGSLHLPVDDPALGKFAARAGLRAAGSRTRYSRTLS